jgi:hypothetical protein
MASPTVPYTFSNATVADATQVNDNFTATLAHITDGTIDYSINSLTLGGTLTANGAVNLGNAASDNLTITASLASTLAIKTKNTYSIGAATLYLANIYSTTAYVSALSALTDVAAEITCNPLLTCSNGLTVSSSKTLTLTGATVAGQPTWSSGQIMPGLTPTTYFSFSRDTVTLVSGAFTQTSVYQSVAGEGGADDDLSTITSVNGGIMVLRASSTAVTITVKTGVGNIILSGSDFIMQSNRDLLMLMYDTTLNLWLELSRSDNGT